MVEPINAASRLRRAAIVGVCLVAALAALLMWGRSDALNISAPTQTLNARADALTTSTGSVIVTQVDDWMLRVSRIDPVKGPPETRRFDLRPVSHDTWRIAHARTAASRQDPTQYDPKAQKNDPAWNPRLQAQSPVQQMVPSPKYPKDELGPPARPFWPEPPRVSVSPDGTAAAWVAGRDLFVGEIGSRLAATAPLDHDGCIPALGADVLVLACGPRLETRSARGGPAVDALERPTNWLLRQTERSVLALAGSELFDIENPGLPRPLLRREQNFAPRAFGYSEQTGRFAAAAPDGSVVAGTAAAASTLAAPGVVDALAFVGDRLLVGGAFRGIHVLAPGTEPEIVVPDVVGTRVIAALGDQRIVYATADRVFVARVAIRSRFNALGKALLWLAGFLVVVLAGVVLEPVWRRRLERELAPPLVGAEAGEIPNLPVPSPPEGFLRACQSGECVLFAGAGLGAQAGYPTWAPFVASLLKWSMDAKKIDPAFSESLQAALRAGQANAVADALVSAVPRPDLLQRLNETFGRTERLPTVLRLLKRIPWCAALTTNFDTLLEQTYPDAVDRVWTPKDAERLVEHLSRREFFIAKLYGSLSKPETVLVAPAEYKEAASRNVTFSQFMEGLFVSRTLVFLGASLDGIEAYLSGLSFTGQVTRTHYALVAVTDAGWRAKADLVRRRYGIEVLPYTPGPDFRELPQFVEACVRAVESESPAQDGAAPHGAGVRRVHLQNIGPFPELTVDLQADWNVVLGDNGVGKSSILKAIAACLCGKDVAPYAARLVRSGEPSGSIVLETARNTYRMDIKRKDNGADVNVVPARPMEAEGMLALGFPPLRAVTWERPKGPTGEGQRRPAVEDLLPLVKGDPDPRMDRLKQWIVNLDSRISYERSHGGDTRYERLLEQFFEIVDRVTPGMTIRFSRVNQDTREVTVITDDGEVPIEMVSQGSVSLMGWIGILLQRLYEIYGDDTQNPTERYALVLIDEIDAHMHPEWQQSVVGDMSSIFPNVQFIATTHSPLVVGGMQARQVIRFIRNAEGHSERVNVSDEMLVGRADQILTGRLFGMKTTLDQQTQQSMERYKTLLGKSRRTSDEEVEFQRLHKELKFRIPLAEETTVERKAYALVQAIVNDQLGALVPQAREPLLVKAKDLINEVATTGKGVV